jgi:serine/threonine protein kinase
LAGVPNQTQYELFKSSRDNLKAFLVPNRPKSDQAFTLGQSGDRVFIIDRPGNAAVRKEVGSSDSHARLRLQFEKHSFASDNGNMEPIQVPKIVSSMDASGYTMEYVHGVPIGQLLTHGSRRQLLKIADVLGDYFERHVNQAEGTSIEDQVRLKVAQLVSIYDTMTDQISKSLGLDALDRLAEYFTTADLSSSWNHGDLSLENLLFQPETEKVFAIDFLDSPFDTILLDAGRLWLDVGQGWWGDGIRPVATSQANLFELRSKLSSRLASLGISRHDLDAFSTLSCLRVLPYTHNPVRKAFLKTSLMGFLGEK